MAKVVAMMITDDDFERLYERYSGNEVELYEVLKCLDILGEYRKFVREKQRKILENARKLEERDMIHE